MEKPKVDPPKGPYHRRPQPRLPGAAAGSPAEQPPAGVRSAPPHHHQPAPPTGDEKPAGNKRKADSPPTQPAKKAMKQLTSDEMLLKKVSALEEEVSGLEEKVSGLENRVSHLKHALAESRAEVSALTASCSALEIEKAVLAERAKAAERELLWMDPSYQSPDGYDDSSSDFVRMAYGGDDEDDETLP